MTGLLEDTNLCAIHTKCVAIMPKDIQLATVYMEITSGRSVFASVVVGSVWVASMGEGGSNRYVKRFINLGIKIFNLNITKFFI